MTAEEVRGVVFQNAALGGYKKSDVDLFLEEVAVCIESMTAKIRALEKAKFDAGQKGISPDDIKPVEEKPVEIEPQPKPQVHIGDTGLSDNGLQSLLIRAQKLAEQIELEAQQAAEELLNKSAEDAKDIIARADSQAEDTIEKANAILAEAERKEASISAAARAEAENIINEAVARSGQMLTSTREKLKAEQEMCEKLRLEFSQVRNVIVGFYEEQLEELRGIDLENVEVIETVADAPQDIELELSQPEEESEPEVTEEISSVSEETEETEIQFDLSSFSEE